MTEQKPAAWLSEVLTTIAGFAALKENWDSYGGPPVNPLSRLHAAAVAGFLAGYPTGIPKPHVGPTGMGNVGFEWDIGDDTVLFEVLPDGRIELGEDDGDRITADWHEITDAITKAQP